MTVIFPRRIIDIKCEVHLGYPSLGLVVQTCMLCVFHVVSIRVGVC